MNNLPRVSLFLLFHLLLRGVEIIALILFVVALIRAFKDIREEEEFDAKESLRETVIATIAFFLFFFFSQETLPLVTVLSALGVGVIVGFSTTFFIRLYHAKTQWFTKGSLIFLILWSLTLLASKITDSIMSNFNYWWLIGGIFAISMTVGNLLNLIVRQKWYRQKK